MPNTAQKMDEILKMQGEGIAILAFHIDQDELAEIASALDPDEPSTGALGRYKGLPVYLRPGYPDILKDMKLSIRDHGGIQYSCAVFVVWD